MVHPPPFPDQDDHSGADPDGGPAVGGRRWVPVAIILLGLAVVVLAVVLHLSGAIKPGMH